MSIEDIARRLRTLGFVCVVQHFDDDDDIRAFARTSVAKPVALPGNHLAGGAALMFDSSEVEHRVDVPVPSIRTWDDGYEFDVAAGIPWSPGGYRKRLYTDEEAYEEVLHYFFDLDSNMRLERTFVPGPGVRPPGA
jgi:hypothetical protein